MPRKPCVFLSHSSSDKNQVHRLAKDLRDADVDVWLDEYEIAVGDPICSKIQEGLDKCDYLAIWLTNSSVKSGWVEEEWQAKFHEEIISRQAIILPLLSENCEIPALLKNKRYADFRQEYSAGLNDLLRTIRSKQKAGAKKKVRVVILAGGEAKRLWPLTTDFPKALLRLAGGSALHHLVKNINNLHNVTEIIVSIDGDKNQYFSEVAEEISNLSKAPLTIYPHALINNNIKGPVAKLQELVNNNYSNFNDVSWNLVVAADNVFTFELNDFVSFAMERGFSSNVVIESQISPREFGVAKTTGDMLNSVLEKPNLMGEGKIQISTGCYIYTGKDIKKVQQYLEEHNGQDNLGCFASWLSQQLHVLAYNFNSEWFDIGTREGLLGGNKLLLARNSQQPTYIHGSYRITGPVFIEDGVQIHNSVIGPDVFVGKNCYIENSKISNSIIYEGCRVISSERFENIAAGSHSIFEGNIGEGIYSPNTKMTTLPT